MKVIILEVEPHEVRPVLNSLFGHNECPMGGGIMVEIGRVDLGQAGVNMGQGGGLASMLAGLRATMENAGKAAGVPGYEVKPPEPPPPPPPPESPKNEKAKNKRGGK